MMLLASPAFGQSIIGEWQLVRAICEGGKEITNLSEATMNKLRIIDKASITMVHYYPSVGELCAGRFKTNYSISDNEYTTDLFLEISSPECPNVANWWQWVIKHAPSHIREIEGFGSDKIVRERIAGQADFLQDLKEGNTPPVLFKISDNNQKLQTFTTIEASKDICPGARLGREYKRIK